MFYSRHRVLDQRRRGDAAGSSLVRPDELQAGGERTGAPGPAGAIDGWPARFTGHRERASGSAGSPSRNGEALRRGEGEELDLLEHRGELRAPRVPLRTRRVEHLVADPATARRAGCGRRRRADRAGGRRASRLRAVAPRRRGPSCRPRRPPTTRGARRPTTSKPGGARARDHRGVDARARPRCHGRRPIRCGALGAGAKPGSSSVIPSTHAATVAGHRTDRVERRRERPHALERDPPVRRLQTDDAAPRRRGADRPGGVGASAMSASSTPGATATAEPLDEPPGTRSGSNGLGGVPNHGFSPVARSTARAGWPCRRCARPRHAPARQAASAGRGLASSATARHPRWSAPRRRRWRPSRRRTRTPVPGASSRVMKTLIAAFGTWILSPERHIHLPKRI